jgi:hypothetical protein
MIPHQNSLPQMLFYRDFLAFTGGHLKVWNYFIHTRESGLFRPSIAFSENSVWDQTNPWIAEHQNAERGWNPRSASALFLAGMDWRIYPELLEKEIKTPVINLIQHVRHGNSENLLYGFLHRPAIRICVSAQVEAAIQATHRVCGPTFVIENGIDPLDMPTAAATKDPGLLISAQKNPLLGERIKALLARKGIAATLVTNHLPRPDYLALLNQYANVLLIPDPTEGFFLPALEAMGLSSLVICPDCVGNRDFCIDGCNCLRPAYEEGAITGACLNALALCPEERRILIEGAAQIYYRHQITAERERYFEILRDIDALWRSAYP